MPVHIPRPRASPPPVIRPKRIEEFVGRVNNAESRLSVAVMTSPGGWVRATRSAPSSTSTTVVLEGCLRVEHDGGALDVKAGEAVLARAGERIRYSSPHEGGARYVAVCLPAFSPETVKREGLSPAAHDAAFRGR